MGHYLLVDQLRGLNSSIFDLLYLWCGFDLHLLLNLDHFQLLLKDRAHLRSQTLGRSKFRAARLRQCHQLILNSLNCWVTILEFTERH
jgi:hypothetical protein